VGADAWARYAFIALCLGFAIGFLVFPTYPNYDSYYSLLWGREVLDLQSPHFQGFRLPTEHPLAIAAGALLGLLGDAGDRTWIALTLASFLALVAGVYRLGRNAFTPLVGAIAAVLLLTRFDFAFLAARGYVDIPYMALVVWAVILETQSPRRGTAVFALLTAAGLLRPEGWLMAGLYFLWMFPRSTWRERAVWALWAAAGPVGWAAVDYAVTGDPLFSLHYTSDSAEDLGRSRSLSEIPSTLPLFFSSLLKLPVALAAGVGLALAVWLTPKRTIGPLLLFATGLGTFLAIAAAGASVIERYLVIAALALLVFAAVALGGWTMLQPGSRLRQVWSVLALLTILGGAGWTATHLSVRKFDAELTFRGDAHAALVDVLENPQVKRMMACGPLTFPNHKLVPDGRWITGLSFEKVRARAEYARRKLPYPDRGVAVYATSRFAIYKHAFTDESDPPQIQIPPDGWKRIAHSDHYAAYARC
jgi:hypothetical protein